MLITIFKSFLYYKFFCYYIVIPYPNLDLGSIIKNIRDKGGRKLFYTLLDIIAGEFQFAKQGKQGKVVQEYPIYLRISANKKIELLDIIREEDKIYIRK